MIDEIACTPDTKHAIITYKDALKWKRNYEVSDFLQLDNIVATAHFGNLVGLDTDFQDADHLWVLFSPEIPDYEKTKKRRPFMLEALGPHAAIISAGSALISAIAVLISTGFIIWTTCFRKTRRDRIDELKEEMQILFSEGWDDTKIRSNKALENFYKELRPKFQKERYKRLHQCAFDELGYEGKNEAFTLLRAVRERYEKGRIVTREGRFVDME